MTWHILIFEMFLHRCVSILVLLHNMTQHIFSASVIVYAQEQPLSLHHPRRQVQVCRDHPAGQGDWSRTFQSSASLSSEMFVQVIFI